MSKIENMIIFHQKPVFMSQISTKLKSIEENEPLYMIYPIQGLAIWAFGAYQAGYYMMVDYGLYWLLGMITRMLSFKTSDLIPPFIKLHVQGKFMVQ